MEPNPTNTSLETLIATVTRLKSKLAIGIGGGEDPSDDPVVQGDLALLSRHGETQNDDKLVAFCKAIATRGSLEGINRNVVLARGSRFLMTFGISLSEVLEKQPHGLDRQSKGIKKQAAPTTKTNSVKTQASPAPSSANAAFNEELLELKGVGPKTAARLSARGLQTILDIVFFLPRRYDDRRTITPIGDLKLGMRAVTSGTIEKVMVYGRPWKRMMQIELADGDHTLCGMWFSNRRPSSEGFNKGDTLILAGLVSEYKDRLQIAHPTIITDENKKDKLGCILPIYPEIPGVGGAIVQKAVAAAIVKTDGILQDPIPKSLVKQRGLLPLGTALKMVHAPPTDVDPETLTAWIDGDSPAHQRLAYDEFFYIQLALAKRRQKMDRLLAPLKTKNQHQVETQQTPLAAQVGSLLGFTPTNAQSRVIAEIAQDLEHDYPMRRLLQGDVGSGKTLVALAAALAAIQNGLQVALMAPTEILAEQHMRTLYPVLRKLSIRAALHIGQARSASRKKTLRGLDSGSIDLVIGTQALIQDSVLFKKLGLVIVDEQHRFGVAQRLSLIGKGPQNSSPHLLVMTATPIPRSLALTLHGDLDISLLDELPPGRKPIKTLAMDTSQRDTAIQAILEAASRGEQIYVVCPIIDESEKLDASAAATVFEQLQEKNPHLKVGLLHGRLSPEDKDTAMALFANGITRILVTTTVVEVGVDVPTATVMMIDGAQRFGLAQLHQLRGRVGRGDKPSVCYLVGKMDSGEAGERMKIMTETTDGFVISREDMKLRGPGELYGKRQAGLPGFKFGDLSRDGQLLEQARQDVQTLLATGGQETITKVTQELTRRILAGEGPIGEESG